MTATTSRSTRYLHVWLNGRLLHFRDAAVPALSDGLLYGLGAFETMRWYQGRGFFRCGEHMDRLGRALQLLEIALDGTHDLVAGLHEAVRRNAPDADVVVRISVTAGVDGGPPDRLIHLRDVSYDPALYHRGVAAALSESPRGSVSARHKLTSYADLWLARRQASRQNCEETLYADVSGRLLEGATTNLFLVKDGSVRTPSTSLPILPGIARKAVLELAPKVGILVSENDPTAEDLSCADEAFLTNSVAEILPLTRIDGRPIGSGRPGGTTAAFQAAYCAQVDAELGAT